MPPMNEVLEWRGQTMVGSGGDNIGKIEEIYLDQETEQPEWALVHTGMFGSQSTFVPIANASTDDDKVLVPFDKARVKDAPKMKADGELSQRDEAALYSHYGMEYTASRSDSGLPEGGTNGDATPDARNGVVGDDVSGQETDAAMTRSEEEHDVVLHEEQVVVEKTAVPKERVRLDKDTVTEQREVSEQVRKEQIEHIDADGEPAEGRDGVRGTDDGAR